MTKTCMCMTNTFLCKLAFVIIMYTALWLWYGFVVHELGFMVCIFCVWKAPVLPENRHNSDVLCVLWHCLTENAQTRHTYKHLNTCTRLGLMCVTMQHLRMYVNHFRILLIALVSFHVPVLVLRLSSCYSPTLVWARCMPIIILCSESSHAIVLFPTLGGSALFYSSPLSWITRSLFLFQLFSVEVSLFFSSSLLLLFSGFAPS